MITKEQFNLEQVYVVNDLGVIVERVSYTSEEREAIVTFSQEVSGDLHPNSTYTMLLKDFLEQASIKGESFTPKTKYLFISPDNDRIVGYSEKRRDQLFLFIRDNKDKSGFTVLDQRGNPSAVVNSTFINEATLILEDL